MAAMQRPELSNRPKVVDELFTEASVAALNQELLERGIPPDQIITILTVPGQTLVKPAPPQFRVLYRRTT
jgi:hypothetical protein